MGILVYTGLPGSGKTSNVISTVAERRRSNRTVWLFVCSDAFRTQSEAAISKYGQVATRNGDTCTVDYFVSAGEAIDLIEMNRKLPSSTFVFEEAQYFGDELLPYWHSLSEEGHDVIISTPSGGQLDVLRNAGADVRELSVRCNLLGDGEATRFLVMPNVNATLAVCDNCWNVLSGHARTTISNMLVANEPYPGERRVYQPIDLVYSEFDNLLPIREDSEVRAAIMADHVQAVIGNFVRRSRTYIDIGCNTGFFCKKMSELGFASRGVDVVARDILVGKLLDAYFYDRHIDFVCDDAAKFLLKDENHYDVMSSFSVFQWVFIQAGRDVVYDAIRRFFAKAKTLVFFEMGYTDEAHYSGRLTETIDRQWCYDRMSESGRFSEIVLYPEGERGLKRDFFVGICK